MLNAYVSYDPTAYSRIPQMKYFSAFLATTAIGETFDRAGERLPLQGVAVNKAAKNGSRPAAAYGTAMHTIGT